MKPAKHPSIWEQDYRWNVSLKKDKTTKNETKKAFDTTAVRRSKRSLPPADQLDEQDENKSSENGEDLLNEYANLSEPQQKRFKDDDVQKTDDISVLKSPPTPKRNPFKTTNPCTNELLSPTRISRENNSLVRNQSPVKRIDYNKLQKLSRFDRTSTTSNQQTLSHFFSDKSPTPKKVTESEPTPQLYFHEDTTSKDDVIAVDENEMESEENDTASEKMEKSNPFAVLNNYVFSQSNRMIDSDDSAVCLTSQTSSTTVQSNGESGIEMDSAVIVESQIDISSESSNGAMADLDEKNDCVEAAIEISDEEVVLKPKPKQTLSKPIEKKKTVSFICKLRK